MPKMARYRCALHDVLAQGASDRGIKVYVHIIICHRITHWPPVDVAMTLIN